MTPALDALLKEVEALDREATPGPWGYETDTPSPEPYAVRRYIDPQGNPVGGHVEFLDDNRMVEEITPRASDSTTDYPLIAHYRTAAPRLAAMLRVAVEALAFYESGSRNAFRCNNERLDPAKGTGPCCERVIDAGGIAQDALARIEAMAKGE